MSAYGSILSLAAMKLPSDVAFRIGDLSVFWYGILLAVGILVTIAFAHVEAARKHLASDTSVDLCLISIPCGLIGARLLYIAMNLSAFQSNPISMLYIWDGGLSVYGAVLFVLVGLILYAHKQKIPFFRLADTIVPGLALAQGIVIWGDFFQQQGYGPQVMNDALQWFPFSVLIERFDTIHYATFFYECIWYLFVFSFLWFFMRKRVKQDGIVFSSYLLLFGFGHGVFEFLRTDVPCLYGNVRASQLVCLLLILFAVALMIVKLAKKKQIPTAESIEPLSILAKVPAADQSPDTQMSLSTALNHNEVDVEETEEHNGKETN
ncbi:MAG: prolipoprotein diacylglyceryl transferase [Clostridia bacterium]